MGKAIAALAVTAGLAGGALVGAPILASAAGGDERPAVPQAEGAPSERRAWAKDAIDGLVAKGTITQPQADAVLGALKEARPDRKARPVARHHALVVSAKALGMEPAALRVELRGGRSIADVAQAKGVDPKVVVDALVADGLPLERATALVQGKKPKAVTP